MTDYAGKLAALVAEARAAGEASELARELAVSLRDVARGDIEDVPADVPSSYGIVGDSPGMVAVFTLIEKVAPTDVPVLVQGETGTGKELVAHALHAGSPRAKKRFLAENCAAVSPTLLESELFGHVKGSFTGAVQDRDGHFVAASGGTLFLDEIGDMPLDMQVKLLRVIEQAEVRPVGASRTVPVDVRLVAASNKDLAAMVRAKEFREDLFYRLNVVRIVLPPLRERNGDVSHLVRYFLAREGRAIDSEALAALEAFDWPGNVRQLENELKRAAALSSGTITRTDLSPEIVDEGNGR